MAAIPCSGMTFWVSGRAITTAALDRAIREGGNHQLK
jgi:hypothetical protein